MIIVERLSLSNFRRPGQLDASDSQLSPIFFNAFFDVIKRKVLDDDLILRWNAYGRPIP
jgi:hypothetical protein